MRCRVPQGPGHRPGISDAFRDADLLADAGLSGRRPLDEALATYEARRDEAALPMFVFTW